MNTNKMEQKASAPKPEDKRPEPLKHAQFKKPAARETTTDEQIEDQFDNMPV